MDPDVKEVIERLATQDSRSVASYVGLVLRKHAEDVGALPKGGGKPKSKGSAG